MVFNFSINSSASSSASSSRPSFPILSPKDADILNEIILQAPPGSSIFSALLDPYQRILAIHQLDPRLDDRFYSLLLKLSLVSGSDWSEKWSRVCADQGLFEGSELPEDSFSSIAPSHSNGTQHSGQEEEGTTTIVAPRSPLISSPSLRRGSLYPIQSTPNVIDRFQPRSSPSSKLLDPLDALSDQFRSEHLRIRTLHLWSLRTRRFTLTLTEVERAHTLLVSGRMWRRWRAKVGKRRREVRMVEGVARTRMKFATLTKWREATEESRHKRWKQYLAQLAADRLQHQQQIWIGEALALWWLKARAARAERTRADLLTHQALTHWLARVSKLRRATNLADAFLIDIKTKAETRRQIARWQEKTQWKIQERTLVCRHESRLLTSFLRKWHQVALWDRQSRQFLQNSTGQRWLTAWRRHLSKLNRLEKRANRIILIRDENLMGRMMNRWMIIERNGLLRRIQSSRVFRNTMDRWRRKLDRVRIVLQGAGQVLEQKLQRRQQSLIIRQWHLRYSHYQQNLCPSADRHYQSKLRKLCLNQWKTNFRQQLDRQKKADITRDTLLSERFLGIWLKRYRRGKILKWVKRRKMVMMKDTFEEWTKKMRRQRWEKSLIANFQLKLDRHRKTYAMSIWLSEVVRLRGRLIQVAREYAVDLLSSRFDIWVAKFKEIKRLEDLAKGFAEIQRIEQRDVMLEFWRVKAMESKSRKEQLNNWLHERRQAIIRNFWERWIDAYVQRDLVTQELSVKTNNVIQTKRRSISTWRQTSHILPAIEFNRNQIKIKTFSHWKTLVPVRKMRRQAEEMDGRKIVGEAWKVWWSKCTAILASRIVSRFTRPVAFASGRRWQGGSPKFPSPKLKDNHSPLTNGRIGNSNNQLELSSSGSSSDSDIPINTIRYTEEVTKEEIIPIYQEVREQESDESVEEESVEEEEDDRTIVGDITLPDSEPIEPITNEEPKAEEEAETSTESEESTGESGGGTESEIELALENFGNRNRRRQLISQQIQNHESQEEIRKSPVWDGLRRVVENSNGVGRLNGIGNGSIRRNHWI
ncbi:Sfi1 spindle body protein-domain-containing protein [Melampsora americana]|nr:Sfi1 spindle body protein-domain-containing protein [Melampsora americana]